MQPTEELYLSTQDQKKADKLTQEIIRVLKLYANYTKPAIVLHAMSQVLATTHITITRKVPAIDVIGTITDTAHDMIRK